MGTAVAPLAGFNSTMQLLKRQLSKIIVLVEFVIYGGLRTPWVYRSSYALIVRFYRNHRVCLCTHTLVFSFRIGTAHFLCCISYPRLYILLQILLYESIQLTEQVCTHRH